MRDFFCSTEAPIEGMESHICEAFYFSEGVSGSFFMQLVTNITNGLLYAI